MTTKKRKSPTTKVAKKAPGKAAKSQAKKAARKVTKSPAKKAARKNAKGMAKAPAEKVRGKAARTASTVAHSVAVGSRAPDFTLPSDQGGPVTLSALRGKKVVLYFYPKDDTPGCTIEACEFRDAQPSLSALGAVVLGVSADSVASHARFREKFALNFPLLADEDHAVSRAYGVWKEKSMYGRTFMGIERSTFLIDEAGMVREVWRKVSPKGHAEVLAGVVAAD